MTKEQTQDDLKPCPFCGSEKLSIGRETFGHGDFGEKIQCGCGASMADYNGDNTGKWNTRVGSAAQEAEQWQPIETAPKDGTKFLASTSFGVRQVWFEDEINDFTFGQLSYGTGGSLCYVGVKDVGASFRLWQPLPAAPKEDKLS